MALDEGGGKPYVPPKKKKSPIVRGEQHSGGSKVPKGGGASASWVIRRQRLLRRAGYGVVVDGIWGPRSQAAWSAYVSGKRYSGLTNRHRSQAASAAQRRRQRQNELRQELRQKAKVASETARKVLQQSRREQRQERRLQSTLTAVESARSTVGREARRELSAGDKAAMGMMRFTTLLAYENWSKEEGKPGPRRVAEKLSLQNLVNTWFDPEVGTFDPQNSEHVTVLQRFIRGQGQKISVDGSYDEETQRALVRLTRQAARQQARARYEGVVSNFYETGILEGGETLPNWFPEYDGLVKVPTAGQLLNLLSRGDFYASMLWRALAEQASAPQTEFFKFREQAIGDIFRDLNPWETPNLWGAARERDLMRTLIHPAMQGPEARAQMGALLSSSSFEQFQGRLAYYQRWEEYTYFWNQKMRAKQDLPWWGSALKWYDQVGDAFRTEIVAQFMFLTHDPIDFFVHNERDIEKWKAKANAEIVDSPTALKFAFEVIVDPIFFIPVAKVTSLSTRGLLASSRGLGRAAAAGASLEALSASRYGLALLETSRLLTAAGERQTYRTALEATTAAIARGELGATLTAAQHAGRLATRLKQEAIGSAKRGIEQSLRFASRPASARAAEQLVGRMFDQNPVKDAALSKLIQGNGTRIRSLWQELNPEFVESLHKEGVSLWLHATREANGWSSVGASIFGRLASRVRTMEVHRLSAEYAWRAREDFLAAHGINVADAGTTIPVRLLGEADAAAREAYEKVIRGAGVYRVGVGDAEIRAVLESRVASRIDHLENVVMVELQNLLEELAERAGVKMFDEQGLWALRAAESQGKLRAAARATFDDDNLRAVENPMFGKKLTPEQKRLSVDEELRIRRAAIYSHYWREIEGGGDMDELIPEMAHRIQKVENEVEMVWRPVKEDGRLMWEDTRETLKVSALYAGHLDEGLEGILGSFSDDLTAWQANIMRLGLPITGSGAGTVDQGLNRMLWYLGSKHGGGPDDLLADHAPAALGVGRHPLPKRDKSRLPLYEEMRDRVAVQQVRLQEAYLERLPLALAREGAVYQALRYSQQRPYRILYRSLQGMLGVWLFATLPLNPGWLVKNLADNTAKTMIRGHLDPRAYFPDWMVGAAQKGIGRGLSAFDNGLNDLIRVTRVFDGMFGTRVGDTLVRLRDLTWDHGTETLRKLFAVHGLEVPETVIDQQRFVKSVYEGPNELRLLNADMKAMKTLHAQGKIDDATFERIEKHRRLTPDEMEQAIADRARLRKFADFWWDLMGSKPENYSRKVVYRDTYFKTRERLVKQGVPIGQAERRAYMDAMAEVEKVLFDYSKITNIEDNLRIVFPFVQFWRKNTTFWLARTVDAPLLPLAVGRFEQYRADAHEDWPDWMRRYFHVREFSDAAARVPGLEWLIGATGLEDVMYDPLNFFSFAPIYRTFKQENPYLSPEDAGLSFLGPMVDSIEQFGLGINPIFRKPLEGVGAINSRAWRAVFPQTSIAAAITRKFVGDWFADRIIDLDTMFADPIGVTINSYKELFTREGGTLPSEKYGEMFDQIVRQEVMNQIARGEQADRGKARRKIQDFYLLQTIISTFTGIYVRRLTPEDYYRAVLQFDLNRGALEYDDLSEEEKEQLKLWRLHRADIAAWEEYVDLLPLIRAYYSQPDYDAKEDFKMQHPELLPHVEPAWRGEPFSLGYVNTARLVADTESAFKMFDLAEKLDLSSDVTRLANHYLVTPELDDFWSANDTPAERREKMLRGQYHAYMGQLSESYFAIPEKDYDAKRGFLEQHPELERYWRRNNHAADDFKMIAQSVAADLRERYFEFAKLGDWDAANAFLTAFPFIFDAFEGYDYQEDRETGRTRSQHSKDYQRASRWLDYYFSLPESQRSAWLRSDAEGAAIVRWYFDRYASRGGGSRGGLTQHAQDYLAAKSWLDHYFSLPKEARSAWLNGTAAGAGIVLAYFKKYGKTNRMERSFSALLDGDSLLRTGSAELRRRLEFWRRYYKLTPDKRPLFVMRNAEKYGVFVYGVLGDQERHVREQRWLRRAISVQGMSNRAAHYMYVKPLLDFYFSLKKASDKQMFLRANPEVREYLDDFSRKSVTGNPKLDKLVERYFKLPEDSQARSLFLSQHPQVQDYFDLKATPAERAMRNLLEVYFDIRDAVQRRRFLQQHPEIQDYFDKRQRERSLEQAQLESFDDADPRLQPFFKFAENTVGFQGNLKRRQLGSGRGVDAGPDLLIRR